MKSFTIAAILAFTTPLTSAFKVASLSNLSELSEESTLSSPIQYKDFGSEYLKCVSHSKFSPSGGDTCDDTKAEEMPTYLYPDAEYVEFEKHFYHCKGSQKNRNLQCDEIPKKKLPKGWVQPTSPPPPPLSPSPPPEPEPDPPSPAAPESSEEPASSSTIEVLSATETPSTTEVPSITEAPSTTDFPRITEALTSKSTDISTSEATGTPASASLEQVSASVLSTSLDLEIFSLNSSPTKPLSAPQVEATSPESTSQVEQPASESATSKLESQTISASSISTVDVLATQTSVSPDFTSLEQTSAISTSLEFQTPSITSSPTEFTSAPQAGNIEISESTFQEQASESASPISSEIQTITPSTTADDSTAQATPSSEPTSQVQASASAISSLEAQTLSAIPSATMDVSKSQATDSPDSTSEEDSDAPESSEEEDGDSQPPSGAPSDIPTIVIDKVEDIPKGEGPGGDNKAPKQKSNKGKNLKVPRPKKGPKGSEDGFPTPEIPGPAELPPPATPGIEILPPEVAPVPGDPLPPTTYQPLDGSSGPEHPPIPKITIDEIPYQYKGGARIDNTLPKQSVRGGNQLQVPPRPKDGLTPQKWDPKKSTTGWVDDVPEISPPETPEEREDELDAPPKPKPGWKPPKVQAPEIFPPKEPPKSILKNPISNPVNPNPEDSPPETLPPETPPPSPESPPPESLLDNPEWLHRVVNMPAIPPPSPESPIPAWLDRLLNTPFDKLPQLGDDEDLPWPPPSSPEDLSSEDDDLAEEHPPSFLRKVAGKVGEGIKKFGKWIGSKFREPKLDDLTKDIMTKVLAIGVLGSGIVLCGVGVICPKHHTPSSTVIKSTAAHRILETPTVSLSSLATSSSFDLQSPTSGWTTIVVRPTPATTTVSVETSVADHIATMMTSTSAIASVPTGISLDELVTTITAFGSSPKPTMVIVSSSAVSSNSTGDKFSISSSSADAYLSSMKIPTRTAEAPFPTSEIQASSSSTSMALTSVEPNVVVLSTGSDKEEASSSPIETAESATSTFKMDALSASVELISTEASIIPLAIPTSEAVTSQSSTAMTRTTESASPTPTPETTSVLRGIIYGLFSTPTWTTRYRTATTETVVLDPSSTYALGVPSESLSVSSEVATPTAMIETPEETSVLPTETPTPSDPTIQSETMESSTSTRVCIPTPLPDPPSSWSGYPKGRWNICGGTDP